MTLSLVPSACEHTSSWCVFINLTHFGYLNFILFHIIGQFHQQSILPRHLYTNVLENLITVWNVKQAVGLHCILPKHKRYETEVTNLSQNNSFFLQWIPSNISCSKFFESIFILLMWKKDPGSVERWRYNGQWSENDEISPT